MKHNWGAAGLMLLAAGCTGPGGDAGPWDSEDTLAVLGVSADDPWCEYMSVVAETLRGGPPPEKAVREQALHDVREEAETQKGGDEFWPFRKALICENLTQAEEKRALYDWVAAAEFIEAARAAAENPAPESGGEPLVPVYDALDGEEPESLAPVDLSNPEYCADPEISGRALAQQRGPLVEKMSFPGSLKRAPDWFAVLQISYQRWGREQVEGQFFRPGPARTGEIEYWCRQYDEALSHANAFSIKENLIFLLPERDNPQKAGRLQITDAEGKDLVLDEVLEAAQFGDGGAGGDKVDFYYDDLNASPRLRNVVARADDLPPPVIFTLGYAYNERLAPAADPKREALAAEIAKRDPKEPLRITVAGHADCVGPRWYNTMISEDRAEDVVNEVVRPALEARGFDVDAMIAANMLAWAGLGESQPVTPREKGEKCAPADENRRVVVVVQ